MALMDSRMALLVGIALCSAGCIIPQKAGSLPAAVRFVDARTREEIPEVLVLPFYCNVKDYTDGYYPFGMLPQGHEERTAFSVKRPLVRKKGESVRISHPLMLDVGCCLTLCIAHGPPMVERDMHAGFLVMAPGYRSLIYGRIGNRGQWDSGAGDGEPYWGSAPTMTALSPSEALRAWKNTGELLLERDALREPDLKTLGLGQNPFGGEGIARLQFTSGDKVRLQKWFDETSAKLAESKIE